MKQIRPPLAFGTVESGVYRSGMPAPSNFSFMDTLQLRTVLLLSQEIPTKAVKTYFSDNHIKTIYLGLNSSGRSGKHLTESLVKDALEIILNSNYHPILIVCSCGLFTTGTVIGCLRRLQNWCLASILDEYRMYTASLSRYANEQFIEHFDVDIVTLPSNLPYWFTLQQSMLKNNYFLNVKKLEKHTSLLKNLTILG
eukprot:gb/GECH01010137.1/.p1 GENE.gb/GECH01010137.1/~~gb/GECH01010137.1/.p1  ORF type:complete len:197 (+),score=26.39 gb/GECH01010137.1/:1-591(+)